jgi:hypothetical protein
LTGRIGQNNPSDRSEMTATAATSRNNVKAVPTGRIALAGQTARNGPNRKLRATSPNRRVLNPNRSMPANVTRCRNVWKQRKRPNIQKARKRGLWIKRSTSADL